MEKKRVLFVSGYLGGFHTGLDEAERYLLLGQLWVEGYVQSQDGDEGGLWVSKHPLPSPSYPAKPGEVEYWGQTVNHTDTVASLEALGFEVVDVEDVHPDFLPKRLQV